MKNYYFLEQRTGHSVMHLINGQSAGAYLVVDSVPIAHGGLILLYGKDEWYPGVVIKADQTYIYHARDNQDWSNLTIDLMMGLEKRNQPVIIQ
jgi:hypothetical protein